MRGIKKLKLVKQDWEILNHDIRSLIEWHEAEKEPIVYRPLEFNFDHISEKMERLDLEQRVARKIKKIKR